MRKYTIKTPRRLSTVKPGYVDELNEQQLEVVMAGEGAHLVIAGAGSGKTRTITYRVARLVEAGIPPERILLLTFTNKAARDMLHRVEILLSADIRRLVGGTFHHVANRLLQEYAGLVGFKEGFTILDREDSQQCIEACVGDVGIDVVERRFPSAPLLCSMVSLSVNTGRALDDIVLADYADFFDTLEPVRKVAERYGERKRSMNAMDFDDLLVCLRAVLGHDEVRQRLGDRFLYILVDEYQDTNKLQADIVDLLASVHGNVTVVGDDCQSIYSFRGASFENIIDFPKRYPGTQVHHLEVNYRSVPEILDVANRSIVNNTRQFEKTLKAHRPSLGEKPALVQLADTQGQAEFVAQRVLELRDEGVRLGQMAVLYRSHYLSIDLQVELARRGIPFEVRSGLRFFEQQHIKDVTAYLRVSVNPLDELSWKRILKLIPRVGSVAAEKIYRYAAGKDDPLKALLSDDALRLVPRGARTGFDGLRDTLERLSSGQAGLPPSEAIRQVMLGSYSDYVHSKFPNAPDRLRDIDNFSMYALKYENTGTMLSELALMDNLSAETVVSGPEKDEILVLSTVHQAKGLEWNVVFLLWCADGRFPSARAIRDTAGEEEERRLFYVALTRAQNDLYVCYPMVAADAGKRGVLMKPSRFITEIDPSVFERWGVVYEAEDPWSGNYGEDP